MNKVLKYGLIAIVIIIPLSALAGHWLALRSEPFAVMSKAISESAEVRAMVGDVRDISLSWFGYSVKYSGPRGEASFEVKVQGTKGSRVVFTDLERSAGEWQIQKMRVAEQLT